jgi:hypothetical protein
MGCIRHIWITIACDESDYPRKIVLPAWWDDDETHSIIEPVGGFSGMGRAQSRNFSALRNRRRTQGGFRVVARLASAVGVVGVRGLLQ